MTADELKDGPLEGENRPLCDYRTKDDTCCAKQAVERIKGRNLCSSHKRFGPKMEPVKGYDSAQAESGDDPAKSEQIVKENAATEFANAKVQPQGVFTEELLLNKLKDLRDFLEMNIHRAKVGEVLAKGANALYVKQLAAITSPDPDKNQEDLPLDQ